MDKSKIIKIVINCLKEAGEEQSDAYLINSDEQTIIFGEDGKLDSLSLVAFISNVEEKIAEEYKTDIVIANERAMSQNFSPFRTVETLASFIEELLQENQNS
jgi:acyl carrier protein